MHVILTHEQADFDALGGLLGAHLLQENTLPVLPRKMNRNARSFLNLYGADLPFIEARDIPAGSIDAVTLVDTQSMVTLKGSGAHTRVHVIDHHQPRTDLPSDWQISIETIGATTTLLTESIQESGLRISPIQATLMLLGIYEDTGSLTYASTTPRDIRAAASLLEQGASLRMAVKYLNPPLSREQRKLYEYLLTSAEWHQFHGQSVVIACAMAEDLNEEISSVAHKIRDLLDPDALFLLVKTKEGIRMVARSTTDRVNVAGVAAHFGGGGHERAAAALLRKESENAADSPTQLETLKGELLRFLPEQIRPAITVGQIMSRRPRLLNPSTPAQEAMQLMQRYGYEGYPVVEDGRVVGLLTRRAVDRALSHRLNLTAGSLMDAGEIVVYPHQPVEQLQKIMSGSGWGQVPVVDPDSGEILGIVTRTDLLKTLTTESQISAFHNLAEKLEGALPPTRLGLLRLVADQATSRRSALYIVGGFVRDLLLERPSQDLDMVVEGDAISLARSLASIYGGEVISHARFGTARWDISSIKAPLAAKIGEGIPGPARPQDLPDSLDLISARTEFYERPTALPTVERSSIKLDLHRRDFTINTLAMRLDGHHYGELHDYWGGLADLRRGIVRVLHSLSFIDDPTRLLRAVRFEQRFRFELEDRTHRLMEEAGPMLQQVSGDRIRHELSLILAEERAPAMLARLETLGLLQAIHPDLPSRIPGDWQTHPPAEWRIPEKIGGFPAWRILAYTLWFSGLTADQARYIGNRLKLAGVTQDIIQSALQLAGELPGLAGLPPSRIAARLDHIPALALYAVYQLAPQGELKTLLRRYTTEWCQIVPGVTGDTLLEIGIPPGPRYRVILDAIRSAWLDGEIHSPAEEQALLNKLLEVEQVEKQD